MRLLILLISTLFCAGMPEYFYKIKDKAKQKKEFIKILLPLIKDANRKILRERELLISSIKSIEKGETNLTAIFTLKGLAKKYKVKNYLDFYSLLIKIDLIPPKLALAQAALESGWGRSRFIKEANNIFGEWTFGKNGIIPKNRDNGKNHKIRIFKTLEASIESYMLNLNSNPAYKEFRKKRVIYRLLKSNFPSIVAVKTLKNYSELKEKYVKILISIIKYNLKRIKDDPI